MKILVISNHYPPYHGGGYGLHCSWYVEGLQSKGHELLVLTERPLGRAAGDLPSPAIEVFRELQPIRHGERVDRLVRHSFHNRSAVLRTVDRCKPDVVFVHGIDGVGFETYRAATGGDVPSLTLMGDTWLTQAWRCLKAFDPWVGMARGGTRPGWNRIAKKAIGGFGKARGLFVGERPPSFTPVVAISKFLSEGLQDACDAARGRVPVCPPILHGDFFDADGNPLGHSGVRQRCLRALFVGRMQMLKGPDTAIEGIAEAVSQGVDVTLTMVGLPFDDTQDRLKEMSLRLGVQDRIHWAGTPNRAELISIYQHHDVFLFPSRIVEGFGVVNVEAMACGLPVVGTGDSGSADAIVDGITGFRILQNDGRTLGSYLAALQQDRELLVRLSRSAIEHARRHHSDCVITQIENHLTNVQQGRPLVVDDCR